MPYLFFDRLSFRLLHVCYSDVECEEFLDSKLYSSFEKDIGSDFVGYRVSDAKLFKFLRDYNSK